MFIKKNLLKQQVLFDITENNYLYVEKILFQQIQNMVLYDLLDYRDDVQHDQQKLVDKDVLLHEVEHLMVNFDLLQPVVYGFHSLKKYQIGKF
jgi:hypothetical protein